MNFSTLSATDVRTLVNNATYAWQESNHKFYDGDHFQAGEGWIGPGPAVGETGRDELVQLTRELYELDEPAPTIIPQPELDDARRNP